MGPRISLDRAATAVGFITVVAANNLYLSGLGKVLDPMMAMDPYYIRMARQPLSTILAGSSAWGPLYALWLKPMTAIFDDPVAVYFANVQALSLGVALVIYLHVLVLTQRAAVAVVAALFFLICDLNVPLTSKVSAFALMVLLAGLTAALLARSRSGRLSIAAAGTALASYARPELYPAAWCLCAAALWVGWTHPPRRPAREEMENRKPKTENRKLVNFAGFTFPVFGFLFSISPSADRSRESRQGAGGIGPFAAVIAILLLTLCFGAPTYGSDRFLIAFREHFAWNWSNWHGEGGTFQAIWQQAFGESHSIFQAVLNNPSAVVRHVFDNLVGTVRFLVMSSFDHYPILAPANQSMFVKAEALFLSAGAFACLAYVASQRALRRRMCSDYGEVLFCYGVIAVFSLGSAAVIYPVAHYLAIPAVMLVLAAILAAALVVPAPPYSSWGWRIAGALLCMVAIPKPFVLPSAYEVAGSRFKGQIAVRRPVIDTIATVRSLNLPPPVQVLTTRDGVGELLGSGFNEIKVWQKGARPLQDFMRDNDVGVIINLEGGRKSFGIDDPLWELIHTQPAAAGFVRVPVPDHDAVQVFVRADLRPK